MEQIFEFSISEVTLVGNPNPKFERRITVRYPTGKLIQIVTLTNRVFTGLNLVSLEKIHWSVGKLVIDPTNGTDFSLKQYFAEIQLDLEHRWKGETIRIPTIPI